MALWLAAIVVTVSGVTVTTLGRISPGVVATFSIGVVASSPAVVDNSVGAMGFSFSEVKDISVTISVGKGLSVL